MELTKKFEIGSRIIQKIKDLDAEIIEFEKLGIALVESKNKNNCKLKFYAENLKDEPSIEVRKEFEGGGMYSFIVDGHFNIRRNDESESNCKIILQLDNRFMLNYIEITLKYLNSRRLNLIKQLEKLESK